MGDDLERIRREAALLRRVVDKISAMLAYWDSDLRCRFANRAYERWFGISPEALIGTHIRDLLGPLYPLNLPYIEGALRGEPQAFEREIPDPFGGPSRHSLANYIPDVVDGEVRGFFVLVTDISEIKRAELALKESEAQFAGIIAVSTDAIISLDEDQRIVMFNQGAEKVFGYTKAEVIGRPLDMLIPTRLRGRHGQHVATFIAGNATARVMGRQTATIVGLRKNGEEFPAEAAISRLTIGKVLLTVALRDITERKRIEHEQKILAEAGAVLASSLNYKQTLTSIAQLVVRHAADLCVIDILEPDAGLQRLTAAHVDPAMAPACEELVAYPLDRRHTLARSALETQQAQVFDEMSPLFLEATAQDDEHLRLIKAFAPRSAIAVPLLSTGGVLGALVFVSSSPGRYSARDIEFATELAHRAALAIENARLYEAAQRATHARDEVLGIVAHDVRSPLNSILLAARTLERQREQDADARGQRALQIIVRSVERANRLIQDLLDITRIEAGALSVEQASLDARPLIDDAMTSQALLASAASIEVRIDVAEGLPEIWADHDRLLQVLENLVGNAIKFTPIGGLITVGAAMRRGDVVFSVADTGPGIPAENLPHVFDRFWQAKRAERRGAGLGLPICKGIVEAHGGRIWAESEPGFGSTFRFTIPTTPRAPKERHQAA
jgi:PAS domain S-box-containing protein